MLTFFSLLSGATQIIGYEIMKEVLVIGAGKIGTLVATLLQNSNDYQVTLADENPDLAMALMQVQKRDVIPVQYLDALNVDAVKKIVADNQIKTVVSCLPYFCTEKLATIAKELSLNYFDLTEDVKTTEAVKLLSQNSDSAFMPQCGLAPGFISIAANSLMQSFDTIDTVKMRVGALPQNPSNALKYSLTWSTDGLINEYGNPCYGIENGEMATLQPLEGYETITLDGVLYEAFNTSGGLGSLAESYADKVNYMNYKTMRYPGHCEKISFLMNDLKLNQDRKTLKVVLENAIPQTHQDVVLVYVSVTGTKAGKLLEENLVTKIYPQTIAGSDWSAIQVSTASGICGVIDILANQSSPKSGFIRQEDISLDDFLNNRFGQYYNS